MNGGVWGRVECGSEWWSMGMRVECGSEWWSMGMRVECGSEWWCMGRRVECGGTEMLVSMSRSVCI